MRHLQAIEAGASAHRFPDGGQMANLINDHNWASSPVGPMEQWPDCLTYLVGVILESKAPMFLLCGPERIFIYNDAYIPVLGQKHPWALGRSLFEIWPEVRSLIEPVVDQAYAGLSSYFEDLPVVLHRREQPEQTYFTFSYNPVRDKAGQVAGALCTLQETTSKVQAEKRLEFLLTLTDRLRRLTDPLEIVHAAAEMLGQHLGVSRVGYGDVDGTARYFTTPRNWTDGTVEHHAGTHDLTAFGPEIHSALQQGEPLVVRDVATDPRTSSPGSLAAFAYLRIEAAVTVSLIKHGRMAAALYVHSSVPRNWTGPEIRLIQDVAERTWDAVERARSEAALRTSESRLRLALDAGRMAVWAHDATTDTITTTPELNRLFGYPPEAQLDAPEVRTHYYPGDRDRLVAAVTEAIRRGEKFFEGEFRFYRLDGSLRWFLIRAEMDLDSDGKLSRSFGVLLDITDRKENEQTLQEREQELRTALEAGSLAIFDVDYVAGVIKSSPRLNVLYGYPANHHLTLEDVYARFHPDDAEQIQSEFRQLREDPSIRQFDWPLRLLLPDGSDRWIHGRGEYIRDEAGRVLRSRGVVLDVTQHKKGEEANARLAAIVSSSPDAIISFDAAGKRILTWNRGAEALFGYTEAEAVGQPVNLLVPPDPVTGEKVKSGAFNQTIAQGSIRLEAKRRRKDGCLLDVSVLATRMTDTDGRVIGAAAIFRDITERKRWEEHQRLLINELNHRVKNTLATVQSVASQTLRNAKTTQEAQRGIEERLIALSLAHNVLTEENWEGASLKDIVMGAVAAYRHEGENRVQVSGPDVRLSPQMALALAMALHELATNAVKYGALSNETGEIRITWAVSPVANGSHLHLAWTESGGPPVPVPTHRGFGTRLIERSLAQELQGRVQLAFEPTGLVFSLKVPIQSA
ncbi:PAS domain S-box protein [Microvirga arabica]|uniref:PAS domain S-box protein n=1 Tax=Microvirga arabica TaxID=1128671 RepID=UPI0019392D95|nr:PAS domain S-box protein [Microvirga arabica]MBM1169966.1 PAS domain S-box protein [Microvirga arabica]